MRKIGASLFAGLLISFSLTSCSANTKADCDELGNLTNQIVDIWNSQDQNNIEPTLSNMESVAMQIQSMSISNDELQINVDNVVGSVTNLASVIHGLQVNEGNVSDYPAAISAMETAMAKLARTCQWSD